MLKYVELILILLLLVASINYGLIGAFNFNLFDFLNRSTFDSALLKRLFYIFIGMIPFIIMYYPSNK